MNPSELNRLADLAKGKGAVDARLIPIEKVVVDERTRYKCTYGCPHYNTNIMCPPYVPSFRSFKRVLNQYKWALLIEAKLSEQIVGKPREDTPEGASPLFGVDLKSEFQGTLREKAREATKGIVDLVVEMEKEAIMMGHCYALGLKAGPCALCKQCISVIDPKKPCLYPTKARPAMEALGIDVLKTVLNAGYANIPPNYFGLILIE